MEQPPKTALRRVVSTPMLALYGIGNIVGAGVYVLIGKIAEPAGYLSVLAFLIAALVAFCAALCYAELAARFPLSAGISVYLHEAFKKPRFAAAVGMLLVLAGIFSTATLLKGFAGYFNNLLPVNPALVVLAVITVITAIALKGIKESVGTAALLTIVEIGGLLFLISSILVAKPGAVTDFGSEFISSLASVNGAALAGVLSASFIAFYAFIGFEDMVNIAEEVRNPQKAFPRAILGALALVTVLYLSVAVVTLGVLAPAVLGRGEAPLAAAYTAATGKSAGIIAVVSLMATLNGIIVNLVMGSRFLYGLSNQGWIHPVFAKVSKTGVPARGLILVAATALLCALFLPIEKLAQATSLLLLLVFLAVNITLIVIRRRDTGTDTAYRISPRFVPWAGAALSGALIAGQAIISVISIAT